MVRSLRCYVRTYCLYQPLLLGVNSVECVKGFAFVKRVQPMMIVSFPFLFTLFHYFPLIFTNVPPLVWHSLFTTFRFVALYHLLSSLKHRLSFPLDFVVQSPTYLYASGLLLFAVLLSRVGQLGSCQERWSRCGFATSGPLQSPAVPFLSLVKSCNRS